MPIDPVVAIALSAGFNALGNWLLGGDREKDANKRLQMQIQAQIELERARNKLPDWAYKQIKQRLSGGIYGGVPSPAPKQNFGAYRNIVGGGTAKPQPTSGELSTYLTGGK